ncbi:nucleotidyltransferase AbiEii toxin of type IV toxin-antitoxin system [Jatrophihabitans sp. GAS493]|uniref:nucleotidyl transferase AbiEii/AbiGii toxin family protein n=1 Tax=Jatrophihabitans sp. GAS493 TaxID=1907575 RepID=UPI000BB97666|nr:nucleotidyl transferase AbiEii/AbiGii toxin family protein [Jatrophihabitans sp. GAS493]SOD75069.1 nucleotidyltransferase AbiEii toxin of type IV toxin-antitoxin system [Jatrophihabitans sp. GAS493]
MSVTDRIRQVYFDRFLCRVFSEGTSSEWLLKGGTGMLARVPNTRATKDVDLYRADLTLDAALAELRRLAELDLGDHFRFEYAGHTNSVAGEGQPYAEGYRVNFDIYLGVTGKGRLNVDLVVSAGVSGEVQVVEPANRLPLRNVVSCDYRLYPIVDQIADKVCATMTEYVTGASSRERDLVDLVVLALTQHIEASSLAEAIQTESQRRRLQPFTALAVPSRWGAVYARLIRSTSFGRDYGTVDSAAELMRQFLDPILDGTVTSGTWSHPSLRWL